MEIKLKLESKNDLEHLIGGLHLAAEDAHKYVEACTPENDEDRKTIALWKKRAAVLDSALSQLRPMG